MASGVSFSVKMKKSQLFLLSRAQKEAAKMAMEALKSDIELSQVVPKDTGTLSNSVSVNSKLINKGDIKITYDTPYARRLYYHPEYNFHTDKHTNAQGKWLEEYLGGGKKDFVRNAYIQAFQMISGVKK